MGSSSAHGENYWQIPPPWSPLLLICGAAKTSAGTPYRAGTWPAALAGAGRLHGGAAKWPRGTVRNLWKPLRAAQASGAAIARGHMYLTPGKTFAVVARARRTPQSPSVRYTSTAISAHLPIRLEP